MNAQLKLSPLDAQHRALGARMAAFGGWDMPISYAGVIDEHMACRSAAVVFDVSHLGTLRVRGPDAFRVLQQSLTNDLGRVAEGQAQYSHLLDATDAHVVDDVIIWWVERDEFFVMPNASNTDSLETVLASWHEDCTVENITAERAVLAVQGPSARELLSITAPTLTEAGRFRVRSVMWEDVHCVVAGTGYTGEDGVEVQVPRDAAAALWDALTAAGIAPAGLGARDTLRLEAGLPLHGHELGPGITPLQAGLGWVVGWDKGPFRGRDALEQERQRGPARRLVGLVCEGRRPPREGCAVMSAGNRVGEVTSGNFSPMLERGIALAFVDNSVAEGDEVTIDVRGREVRAEVGTTRFLQRL